MDGFFVDFNSDMDANVKSIKRKPKWLPFYAFNNILYQNAKATLYPDVVASAMVPVFTASPT